MTVFVPRSSDREFCAHELCPKGTVCHCTEELPTILPLASLQVAIVTNSDQGQPLPSAQRTGEEVAAVWLHYLRQEQKCSLCSDRAQGRFPSPWCSSLPCSPGWKQQVKGLWSVPKTEKHLLPAQTCLSFMLHTHHISLKIIFNLFLFFLLKNHLRNTVHLQEATLNCSSTTGHAQTPFHLDLWNEGEEAKIPRIPPTLA